MKRIKWNCKGFTLIEMVIVIAIIGALMLVLMPTERPDTDHIQLKADFLQMELALNNYRSRHGDYPGTNIGLTVLYEQVAGAPANWQQSIKRRKFITGPNKQIYYYEYSPETFPKILYLGSDNALGGDGRAADVDLRALTNEE